jgi:hypothetical protein
MNGNLLERLLAVAKKTGDRLVVVEGDTAVVLLPIDQYEQLLGGNEVSLSKQRPDVREAERLEPSQHPSTFEKPAVTGFRTDMPQATEDIRVLDSIANETALDEEQFYLEPVE